jgi:hypothetical protein
MDFILDQLVPDDKAERERITRRSANYVLIGSDLSYGPPWAHYLGGY